jgi:hypothetical protein
MLAGRIANLSVRTWMEAHSNTLASLPYALLSSIDSHGDVANMEWVRSRQEREPTWALSTEPLVISGTSLVELLGDRNLFTGFDEVWIPSSIPVGVPPKGTYLVSPRDLSEGLPSPIRRWLTDSPCEIGVGDGYGLNYVVADVELGGQLGLP